MCVCCTRKRGTVLVFLSEMHTFTIINLFEALGSIDDSCLCLFMQSFLEFFRLFYSFTTVNQCEAAEKSSQSSVLEYLHSCQNNMSRMELYLPIIST